MDRQDALWRLRNLTGEPRLTEGCPVCGDEHQAWQCPDQEADDVDPDSPDYGG